MLFMTILSKFQLYSSMLPFNKCGMSLRTQFVLAVINTLTMIYLFHAGVTHLPYYFTFRYVTMKRRFESISENGPFKRKFDAVIYVACLQNWEICQDSLHPEGKWLQQIVIFIGFKFYLRSFKQWNPKSTGIPIMTCWREKLAQNKSV